MSWIVRPFEPSDGIVISQSIQPNQTTEQQFGSWTTTDWMNIVNAQGIALTGLLNGKPIACGGLTLQWHGRAIAWTLISEQADRYAMLRIHRACVELLRGVRLNRAYRRIECSVIEAWETAHEWALMLGFRPEGLMRCYDEEGNNCRMYARISDDLHTGDRNRNSPAGRSRTFSSGCVDGCRDGVAVGHVSEICGATERAVGGSDCQR